MVDPQLLGVVAQRSEHFDHGLPARLLPAGKAARQKPWSFTFTCGASR